MSAYDVCAAISFAIMAALVSLLVGAAVVGSVCESVASQRQRIKDEQEYGKPGDRYGIESEGES